MTCTYCVMILTGFGSLADVQTAPYWSVSARVRAEDALLRVGCSALSEEAASRLGFDR